MNWGTLAVDLAQRLHIPYDRVMRMPLKDALRAQLDATAVMNQRKKAKS